ncbi:antiterminator LoaP [Adlercreutzia sp. ZJ304]|uniref:antiterminator LoaP n=1 Tax=Adlercreutzia sp. ZJ304 TaxID=2709791 RepID=UPI0013EAB12A|nr:antiterminator LoaP [Adlercreutzia sp. ZJ304]
MWYVVQVATGQEQSAVDMICEAAAGSAVLKECFCPHYKTGEKCDGVWETVEKVLFPGYIIVVTNQVERVEQGLRGVKAFTRLLGNDKAFIPLSKGEVAWIDAFTQKDNRTVQMSEGYVDGGKLVITAGPLLHHEGLIRKVNHRKKRAYLQVKMFGRMINAEVGLAIRRKS